MASLLYPALFHSDLAFDGPDNAVLLSLLELCWHPCPHCAGFIAGIALSLLLVLSQHHCPCCAGAFALVALALLPLLPRVTTSIAKWPLPSHEAFATCAGVIVSIMPLLLLVLRQHCCPCHVGIFALVTLELSPLPHLHCCQHHKLASAQS